MYMNENEISSINTYKTAVQELCKYLFIYPHAKTIYKDYYWINPSLMFSGNRIDLNP